MLNGTRPTLLVVEDEEVIGLSLNDSLDEAGLAVQLFSDAAAVLACIDHIKIDALLIRLEEFGVYGSGAAECSAEREVNEC